MDMGPNRDGPGSRKPGRGGDRKGPGGKDADDRKRRNSRFQQRERGGANRLDVNRIQSFKGRASLKRKKRRDDDSQKPKAASKIVDLGTEPLSVADLAEKLDAKPAEVVKYLMMDMGIMATITQSVDVATAKTVTEAFGWQIQGEDEEDDELMEPGMEEAEEEVVESSVLSDGAAIDEDDPDTLMPRAPVVTIMGHVDHGKTSLLDAIRQEDVVSGEAGGITQHVGAYQVMTESGQAVTFIDTPGHAAFSEMRQRGADCTDIVILVVAADEGVKEQTAEALAAARAANKPVIVAFNKIDKEGADVSRVASELTSYDLLVEEFGGDVLSAEVSAKSKLGLDQLLEKVLLQSEILELQANPERMAQGVVIEAKMEKGRGVVATTLIQRGTLRVGDFFIAGAASGKVRTLVNDKGERVQEAGPSTPIQVTGLDGVPAAGDLFIVGDDEGTLRNLAEARSKLAREKSSAAFQADLKQSLTDMLASGGALKEIREVPVLIKADVQGSVEALTTSLREIVAEDEITQVKVKVLQSSVGEVTKSDVAIAGVSKAWILAFNVAANFQAQEDAREKGLEIGYYSIVYDILEEMESRMQEVLSPTPDGELVGKAEVKMVFDIGKVGKIAGCGVVDGDILKAGNVRVLRGPRIVYEGQLTTLKHVKEDVTKISAGSDCGMAFEEWEGMEEGDVVECYKI